VWQRDGGRCAFVDADGRRCSATARLEVHHVVPFGRGGDHSVENLRLMCQSHNSYQAEVDYGRTFIEARRQPDQSKSDTDDGPPT
jgi:5-methylcytosine-specific restriction endonuclease McrA